MVFWVTFAWGYVPEFLLSLRSRSTIGAQDAGSMPLIVLVQQAAATGAFVVAYVGLFGVLSRQQLWFWLGLGMLITGSLLRRHCFRMLGTSFTAGVVVVPGQAVVERGAYRWVRHPSYTAG